MLFSRCWCSSLKPFQRLYALLINPILQHHSPQCRLDAAYRHQQNKLLIDFQQAYMDIAKKIPYSKPVIFERLLQLQASSYKQEEQPFKIALLNFK
jgi:hypothetical protein